MADLVPSEARPTQENRGAVQGFVDQAQNTIINTYALQDKNIPKTSERIWDGTDDELKSLLSIRELNPNGETYGVTVNGENLGQIIYFNPQLMERVAHSSPKSRLAGDIMADYLTIVEETSHDTYKSMYAERFGKKPHSANVELIGVLDKYFVHHTLYQQTFGKPMDPDEELRAISQNASAHLSPHAWKGERPAEYIVGHQLGAQYLQYLRELQNLGVDISPGLQSFYIMSNKEQAEHLLYNAGCSVDTYSDQEETGVAKVFQELGAI